MDGNFLFGIDAFQSLGWLIQILIVLVLTFIADRIKNSILKRIQARLDRKKTLFSRSVVMAVRRPASYLIWIIGILFSLDILQLAYSTKIFEAIPTVRTVAVVTILTWFVIRLIRSYENNLIQVKTEAKVSFDLTAIDFSSKLLRISAVFLGILVAMQSLGFDIAGIVAFGGVGGIAVGFAARELIANYFGGLMLYLDRPFEVGESISSLDGSMVGTVEQIGWRQTVVRQFDSRPLYIPNNTFSTMTIRNLTRQTRRRFWEFVGIRYDDADQMNVIVKAIKEMLMSHPQIDQEDMVSVNLERFEASSLEISIYCLTHTTDWAAYNLLRQDILKKVMDIITEHDAEIAFPTSTLHIANSPPVNPFTSEDQQLVKPQK